MPKAEQLIDRLDAPTKQLLIEARLMETIMNPSSFKGVDWSSTLGAQHISYGNGLMSGQSLTSIPGAPVTTTTTFPGGRQITSSSQPSSSTSNFLSSILGAGGFGLNTASGITPNIGFLNADGVRAVLSLINAETEAKIISAPRTVT